MDWKTIVGNIAVTTTVCLFLAGIPICCKIWTARSTVGISILPMLTGFVSCLLWLFYGYLKSDVQIEVVNAFGLVAQTSYILFYLLMSSNKCSVQRKIVTTTAVPVLLLYLLKQHSDTTEALTHNIGLVACLASLVFFASPLSNVVLVVRTRNTSSLPLPLISLSCLQSFLWFIYGVLAHDTFVQIPNLIGVTITFLQLLLFVIFPLKTQEMASLLIEHGIN